MTLHERLPNTLRALGETPQGCIQALIEDGSCVEYLLMAADEIEQLRRDRHATADICDRLRRLASDVVHIYGVDIADQIEDLIRFYRDGGDNYQRGASSDGSASVGPVR